MAWINSLGYPQQQAKRIANHRRRHRARRQQREVESSVSCTKHNNRVTISKHEVRVQPQILLENDPCVSDIKRDNNVTLSKHDTRV